MEVRRLAMPFASIILRPCRHTMQALAAYSGNGNRSRGQRRWQWSNCGFAL